MRPRTTDTALHLRLLADLEAAARNDARIRAAWLEGSFATDTADAGSDLDLHVAVPDDEFESFCDQARDWLAAVRPLVGVVPVIFGPRRLFPCALADGTRLDLFVELVSDVARPVRPVEPRVLFDHDGLLEVVQVDPATALSPVPRLREILNTYLFGFTFPARLSVREEWGSLQLNSLLVLYQFLVPAMLAQRHPQHAFRPQLHNERFLDPDQRERVDALATAVARTFAESPPDPEALRTLHRDLFSTLLNELNAATEAHDIPWPADEVAAIRSFLADELGVEVD